MEAPIVPRRRPALRAPPINRDGGPARRARQQGVDIALTFGPTVKPRPHDRRLLSAVRDGESTRSTISIDVTIRMGGPPINKPIPPAPRGGAPIVLQTMWLRTCFSAPERLTCRTAIPIGVFVGIPVFQKDPQVLVRPRRAQGNRHRLAR